MFVSGVTDSLPKQHNSPSYDVHINRNGFPVSYSFGKFLPGEMSLSSYIIEAQCTCLVKLEAPIK